MNANRSFRRIRTVRSDKCTVGIFPSDAQRIIVLFETSQCWAALS